MGESLSDLSKAAYQAFLRGEATPGMTIRYEPIDPGRMEGDLNKHSCQPIGPFEHGQNDGYPAPCMDVPFVQFSPMDVPQGVRAGTPLLEGLPGAPEAHHVPPRDHPWVAPIPEHRAPPTPMPRSNAELKAELFETSRSRFMQQMLPPKVIWSDTGRSVF